MKMHEESEMSDEMKQLTEIVWTFRNKKETKYNWQSNKTTFLGKCRDFSFKLAEILEKEGYKNSKVVCGQYVNFSQEYLEREDLGFGPVEFLKDPNEIDLKVFKTPHGFYVGVDSAFLKRKQKLNLGKLARFIEEGYFDTQHCWLVVNNEYIIDVSVDQFHPDDPDPYRVKITDIHNPGFKPYGDERLEPKPLEFSPKVGVEEKIRQLEARVRELERQNEELLLKLCVSTAEMV